MIEKTVKILRRDVFRCAYGAYGAIASACAFAGRREEHQLLVSLALTRLYMHASYCVAVVYQGCLETRSFPVLLLHFSALLVTVGETAPPPQPLLQ